jgi:nucleotide-binding universal stress UspA family protein
VNEAQRDRRSRGLYWHESLGHLNRSLARHAEEAAMKTILVPLDGSAVAEQVMPSVRRLAPILAARVHLLVVITDAQKQHLIAQFAATPPGTAGQYETDWHWERRAYTQLAHAAEDYLADQAQALRAAGLDVTFEVTSGAPADRIVDVAASEPQALIAMATHGYSGLRRWTLGSVADKVVQATQTPILLVRAMVEVEQPAADAQLLRRILVPLDGSALAEQVLPLAIELAVDAQAELLLFHAVRPLVAPISELLPLHRPPPTIDFPAPGHAQALQRLHGAAERWHPHELTVLPVVTAGEPAQAIVEAAANEHADLIVMATHGYSGVRRWALGSVADKVLHATATPLLLVRAQAYHKQSQKRNLHTQSIHV